MKAIIYARCSTDETKQDVEIQLKELRRYCEAYNWPYDEVSEYGSGYKDQQPKLKELLERIRKKEYDVLLVYSLDRFSRQHPAKTNALLDTIVYDHKCRFIALQQSIDSNNEMVWNVIKPLFTYFSNIFSKNLSDKVSKGIQRKKEKGEYKGGRPEKNYVKQSLNELFNTFHSLRKTAQAYNKDKPKQQQLSYGTIRNILLKKHSEVLPIQNLTETLR